MREWSATFCIKEVTFCIMTAGTIEKHEDETTKHEKKSKLSWWKLWKVINCN